LVHFLLRVRWVIDVDLTAIETHERPDGKATPVECTRCGGRSGLGRKDHE